MYDSVYSNRVSFFKIVDPYGEQGTSSSRKKLDTMNLTLGQACQAKEAFSVKNTLIGHMQVCTKPSCLRQSQFCAETTLIALFQIFDLFVIGSWVMLF